MSASIAKNDYPGPPLAGSADDPLQNSMPKLLAQVIDISDRNAESELNNQAESGALPNSEDEYLLNAQQVAARLGVSERFIRDHTYRRSPRIRAVKMGKLTRYRRVDVDLFLAELATMPPSRRSRSGV